MAPLPGTDPESNGAVATAAARDESGCLATKKMRNKREKKRMNKSALITYKVIGYKIDLSEALHLYLKTITS